MIALSLQQVADCTAATLVDVSDPAAEVTGIAIDSRAVEPGDLFVALPGEHADGHQFAAAAVAAGAVAVLALRPVGVPAVVVEDPVSALGAVATEVLRRRRALPAPFSVVGVTGSAGKTTTKDLLAKLFAPLGPVVAARGSYNNDLGLPLTVAATTETTRVLVLELGARGRGHIASLTRVARPDVGVVLGVGSAHIGMYPDGQDGIAAAKSELVAALPADGLAVLNADDPRVLAMGGAGPARVTTFGRSRQADLRATDVSVDADGRAGFALDGDAVQLRLVGEHQVTNALAAAAVALQLGVKRSDVVAALCAAEPASRWRMERTDRADGVTVINDAYNASPDSMRAALKTLLDIARPAGRRSVAVLGEMAELGDLAASEHDAIGRLVVRLDIGQLLVVGAAAGRIHAGAVLEGSWGTESVHVQTVEQAQAFLAETTRPDDVVLVKGSRVAGLEQVAHALLHPVARR